MPNFYGVIQNLAENTIGENGMAFAFRSKKEDLVSVLLGLSFRRTCVSYGGTFASKILVGLNS